MATHHFGGGTRIEKFYEEPCVPSAANKASAFRFLLRFKRSRSSMYRAPRFERGGCRRESCRECQFTGMWLNPNSRGSRLRIWQPWGCNSLHAHHLSAPGLRGNSRPVRLKIEQPWECKSPHADQFGMSTGRASRASVLTSACLRASGATREETVPSWVTGGG